MKKIIGLALVLTSLAWGTDVSGKWTGAVEIDDSGSGTTIKTPIEVEFQQAGANLSGTIGRRGEGETVQIRNGRVEGNTVSFEAASIETTKPMRFSLVVDGDRMQGEMKGSIEEGEIVGKVYFQRVK